jgi:chemotaxis signal transduction protein
MKINITELVFILDKSGSMSGLESDTIGGYNAMLKKQQQEEGEAVVTTVLFDNNYELLHDRINIKGIQPITEIPEVPVYVKGIINLRGKIIPVIDVRLK